MNHIDSKLAVKSRVKQKSQRIRYNVLKFLQARFRFIVLKFRDCDMINELLAV